MIYSALFSFNVIVAPFYRPKALEFFPPGSFSDIVSMLVLFLLGKLSHNAFLSSAREIGTTTVEMKLNT